MSIIFVFHGYGSTSETSRSVKEIKEMYKEYEIVTMDYDADKPTPSEAQMSEKISTLLNTKFSDAEEVVFLGISLGGFWARYFSNKYPFSKLIMVNPSLDPKNSLQKYMSQEKCFDYIKFEVDDLSSTPIFVLLAEDDQVVNPLLTKQLYDNRAMLKTCNGGHRLDLLEYRDFFLDAINHFPG